RSRSVPGLDLQSTLGSMMSLYSEAGDFDSVEVKGDVVFSLAYDERSQSLQVFIKECHELAYGDASRSLLESYLVLSGDEVEEGQALEQESESSEEGIPGFKGPEEEQNNIQSPLWIRSIV
uniref:Uncharacterized protein n=1 Tax=Amphilophus citrinellus TaxID=61819 RepID=A0A3Q0S0Y5_AMPCI